MSERRVERFRRLMAAQERITEVLTPFGVTDEQLRTALVAAEQELPRDEADDRDFYRPALERFVKSLGGHLDHAVVIFPDVTVTIEPGDTA